MLFGQCPHGGGDKLKGASLRLLMIDDQNMLTECYSSWSTNTRKQALILIDCWTTLPKYSESSFELSELSGTLRWQAHFCGDLVITNTTLVLFTAHPYSHAASRPLSQAPLWPIRRTRLALILSISFSSQITLFRQQSYLIIVSFSNPRSAVERLYST